MKIMLVLFFCSKMAGTCLPPFSPGIVFEDKYSCLTYGYKLSHEIMTELGPEKVNKDYGITLLVIEHNMKVIMSLAQSIFCLAHGKMLANGSPDEIKNDKRVIDAYLGAQ